MEQKAALAAGTQLAEQPQALTGILTDPFAAPAGADDAEVIS
jgi:hypothetical protein